MLAFPHVKFLALTIFSMLCVFTLCSHTGVSVASPGLLHLIRRFRRRALARVGLGRRTLLRHARYHSRGSGTLCRPGQARCDDRVDRAHAAVDARIRHGPAIHVFQSALDLFVFKNDKKNVIPILLQRCICHVLKQMCRILSCNPN